MLIKGPEVPLRKATAALRRRLVGPTGGTDEASALVAAEREFSRHENEGRILAVVTDGETYQHESAEMMIHDMETRLGVLPVFVGLGVDVPDRYRLGIRVDTQEELSRQLPELLARSVTRGRH